jgi:hypothetical protein
MHVMMSIPHPRINIMVKNLPDNIHLGAIKGIVQQDLTGVETRLKRSALMNYSVTKVAF